ncbi:hypothetical protein TNCV_3074421 [Trichonephila clavipes]|uniref:Uncharacterized protein n=1 Tax=Trichonephila clavipes TaxID=2585209 RepID=A0A8X6SPK0_TRICX|nr:hypothetical protein TNCV_3074421 [Trichonephila clavipes]
MSRECFCVLRTNWTGEADEDFCGLPMKRDDWRVVDPPLVFKMGSLGDERRALYGENLRRALKKRSFGLLRLWRTESGVERTERR